MEEGQTISLVQTIKEHEIEKEYEELVREEGSNIYQKEAKLDPK